MMEKVIEYLACPYAHKDESIRKLRFEQVTEVAAKLARKGHKIFSPITHGHQINIRGDSVLGWQYWRQFDFEVLRISKKMFVLTLDGWKESRGVTEEIELARQLNIDIDYLSMEYV